MRPPLPSCAGVLHRNCRQLSSTTVVGTIVTFSPQPANCWALGLSRTRRRLAGSAVLGGNKVPVAAAIYVNDMYVEREFSVETAQAIRGTRT